MQKAEIVETLARVLCCGQGFAFTDYGRKQWDAKPDVTKKIYIGAATSVFWALGRRVPGGEAALMALVNGEAAVVPKADWDDMKLSVVAFGALWAEPYARDHGLPEGHLAAEHYDILEKAGARMDAFTRAASPYAAKEGRDGE